MRYLSKGQEFSIKLGLYFLSKTRKKKFFIVGFEILQVRHFSSIVSYCGISLAFYKEIFFSFKK